MHCSRVDIALGKAGLFHLTAALETKLLGHFNTLPLVGAKSSAQSTTNWSVQQLSAPYIDVQGSAVQSSNLVSAVLLQGKHSSLRPGAV